MSPISPRSPAIRASAALLAVALAGCAGPFGPTVEGAAPGTQDGAHHAAGGCVGVHEGQPALGTEHCDAMALTDPSAATHTVIASGPWSSRDTWQDGRVPDDGAAVHVPAGLTVTIDGVLAATHDTVRIDGTLRFAADTTTEIRIDTLVGSPASTFEMGRPDRPIDAGVTATLIVADRGPIDTTRDPAQLGRGVVLHGTVVVHGADRTDWAPLAEAPVADDETVTLEAPPQGWRAGDRLALAGVRPDGSGDEEATVRAVEGARVLLDAPLVEDHTPPRADLSVHVANLTRNAIVRSESTALDRRGHVMFMHTRDVQVTNAGFYDLGRTDKSRQLADLLLDEDASTACAAPMPVTNPRARYSVHFHRNGVADDGEPARVTGSVVDGNPGWGFVNHSSNVDFVDNVAFDVAGSAYNTEVGDEVGSFVRNISIRTHGLSGIPAGAEQPTVRRNTQDFGWEGHGFWLQGPGVRLDGNVASGATGAGIMIYAEALTEPVIGRSAMGDEEGGAPFPVAQQPLAGVADSTTYGSVTGLWIYYHRTGITLDEAEAQQMLAAPPDLPLSLVDGVQSFANVTGVRANYTVDTEFRDVTIVAPGPDVDDLLENDEAREDLVGFDASNVYNHGIHRYVGFDIEGYPVGLRPAPSGEVTIDGGRFANHEVDIAITPARQEDRLLRITGGSTFPGAEDDGRTRIAADGAPMTVVDSDETWYQLTDRLLVDLDGTGERQLFYDEQRPDVVIFPGQPEIADPEDPGEPVPEEHIGLTNAELEGEGGPFAGSLVTDDARPVPGIDGLVGSPQPEPARTLDAGDVLVELLDDEEEGETGAELDEPEESEESEESEGVGQGEEHPDQQGLSDEHDDDEAEGGGPLEREGGEARVGATCGPDQVQELDEILAESGEQQDRLDGQEERDDAEDEGDEGDEGEDGDAEPDEGDDHEDDDEDERDREDEGVADRDD